MSLLPRHPRLHNELIHLENILHAYRDGKNTRLKIELLCPDDVVMTAAVRYHDDSNGDLQKAWQQGYERYAPAAHYYKASLRKY